MINGSLKREFEMAGYFSENFATQGMKLSNNLTYNLHKTDGTRSETPHVNTGGGKMAHGNTGAEK